MAVNQRKQSALKFLVSDPYTRRRRKPKKTGLLIQPVTLPAKLFNAAPDMQRRKPKVRQNRSILQKQIDLRAIRSIYEVESTFDSRPLDGLDTTLAGKIEVRKSATNPGFGSIEFNVIDGYAMVLREIILTPSKLFVENTVNGLSVLPAKITYTVNGAAVTAGGNVAYNLSDAKTRYGLFIPAPVSSKVRIDCRMDLPGTVPNGEGCDIYIEIWANLIPDTGEPLSYMLASKRKMPEDVMGNVIYRNPIL